MLSMFRSVEMPAEPLHVAVDLVYTTSASCRAVTQLPSSSDALATSLLPSSASFRGNLQLSKAASGDGCALYLTVKGAVVSDFHDAFDVAGSVYEQLTQLLSAKGVDNVSLTRAAVALDGDKLMAVSLTPEEEAVTHESVLTVQQGACEELLQTLQSGDGEGLLPRQVETSALDVTRQTDAATTGECQVALEVAALAPRLEKESEVFQLLKAVDQKMEGFFDGQAATLATANVRLQVAAADVEKAQTLAVQTERVTATPTGNVEYNPPSYEEALGIFALVAALVAMMMGVMVQKKRNEQRSRERYDRANRAAQIRRVSIRMSQYDQDGEGEQDSLL
jgi:hypothetical protein